MKLEPVLLAALLAVPFSPAPSAGADGFVIRNVRIFDGARTIPAGEVWVDGGVIRAVGDRLNPPAGTAAIDGGGGTLLPGLIDAHTHAWTEDALKDALAFGVTTELDMFTSHAFAAGIKQAQAEGKDLDLADLRSAGTLVTAPHGHGTEYGMAIPTLSSPDSAQAFVDARIAEGSDYIKIIYDDGKTYGTTFPTLSKETMAAVAQAARRRGKLSVAHIGSAAGARDAIEAGVDGLAHLFVDAPPDPDFASLVASRHAFVVPTLSVLASIAGVPAGKAIAEDPRLKPYLSAASSAGLSATFGHAHGSLDNAKATVRALRAAHVPLLAGTDAPNPGTTHGASLHGELALLVDAGLTPAEALAAATSVPARVFHLDDRGRIEAGRRADLLLVRGDPTADITATRDIVSVWKDGVALDRAAVLAAREADRKAAAAAAATPPAGSESGLISDFEDGALRSAFGAGWMASSDSLRGGASRVRIKVVPEGAGGSKGALQIDGIVMDGPAAWAGAIFFPGARPMAPANLSARKEISFLARGDVGTYSLMVFAQANGYMPKIKTFTTGRDWTKVTLPFTDFETDGHDVMGIFIGGSTAGHFLLTVDDVRLE